MQGGRYSSNKAQIIPEENLIKVLSIDEAKQQLQSLNQFVNSGRMTYEEYFNTIGKGNTVLRTYVTTTDQQSQSAQGLVKASQEARAAQIAQNEAIQASTLSAKAATVATKALSVAGNMLVMYAVSQLIRGFYELSQVSETVAKKAKEIGNSFSSTKSDIEGYKDQIRELYQTINNSGSSLEEVTNARKNLMSIQDELIDKFGTERETIESITEAICGETDALDGLTERQWQASKNEFNNGGFWNSVSNFFNGYSDNIDRMEKEYANYTAKFDLSLFNGFLNQNSGYYEEFKKLLQDDFDVKISMDDYGTEFAEISGNATKVYETLLDIQNLSDEFDFGNGFNNYLTQLANSAKDTSDKYADFYNQHILEDKIFKDDDYTSSFNQIRNAYKEYQNASFSSDKAAIEKSTENFRNILAQATDGITDESVLDFFNNMYPAMQVIVDKWEFKAKILPEFNTEALEGKTQNDILAMLQTNGEEDAEKIFNEIVAKAKECDLITDDNAEGIQKVLDLLVKWGILQGDILSDAEAIDPKWDYSTTITQLDTVRKKLNVLDQTYAKLFDEDSSIGFEDLSSIAEAFGDIEELDITSFIQQLQEAGQNGGQVKSVMGNLISKYLSLSGVLDNVTAENQQLITSFLEENGIVNANEIITAQLAAQTLYLSLNTDDATASIYDQVSALIATEAVSGTACTALYNLIAEENIFSNSDLDTTGKIKALEELALSYGITADAAHSSQAYIDAARFAGTYGGEEAADAVVDSMNNYYQDKMAEKFGSINAEYDNRPTQKGDNFASKVSDAAEKETDIMSELNSEMDEYQSKLKAIKEARETYNEHGKISIDQAQEILDADFKLLAAYGDEEAALEDLGRAKLNEMQIHLLPPQKWSRSYQNHKKIKHCINYIRLV